MNNNELSKYWNQYFGNLSKINDDGIYAINHENGTKERLIFTSNKTPIEYVDESGINRTIPPLKKYEIKDDKIIIYYDNSASVEFHRRED